MNMTEQSVIGKQNRSFERRNSQTSRAGWRPRKTSQKRLAEDIALSIQAHEGREIAHYTLDLELTSMVKTILGW
jgi:hypothetical protein